MWRFEDFVEASRDAKSVPELASLCRAAIAADGYENCVLTSLLGKNIGHVAWLDFPDGYAGAYLERRWQRIDPVLSCSLRATRPFFGTTSSDKRSCLAHSTCSCTNASLSRFIPASCFRFTGRASGSML